jgi:hypothetical protein
MNITEFERWSQIPVYPSNNLINERINLHGRNPKTEFTTRQAIYDANMHQKNKTYTIMSSFKGFPRNLLQGTSFGDVPEAYWSVKHHAESSKTRQALPAQKAGDLPQIVKLHSKALAEQTEEINLRRLAISTQRYDFQPQRLE